MSGEKRTPVQILQQEMRSTRRELQDIKKQRERLQKDLQIVKQESKAAVKKVEANLLARDKKQQAAVKSLKSDLRHMASTHSKQLSEQRKEFLTELQKDKEQTAEQIENLRDWTQDRLNAQRTEYRRITFEQQAQLNNLKQEIEQINLRESNREQRAQEYIEDLETLISAAEENLPHEKYAPGELVKIRRQLNAARNQLADDVPSATIATAQSAHFALMDLEEEVLRKEAEFEMTYQTVADSVSGLLSSVRTNRNINLEEDPVAQEANYWTDGKYQELEDQVQQLNQLLRDNKYRLTTEEVRDMLDELEELSNRQTQLIEEAVERIISSQIRAEMSDQIIETLNGQGYRITNDECGYASGDQRGAYLVKMKNIAGTEIVTIITPEDETYNNTVSINTYGDEVNDENATKSRNLEMRKALQEAGLKLGETKCYADSISELYDVKNLLAEGKKKLPKNVLKKARGVSGQQSDLD